MELQNEVSVQGGDMGQTEGKFLTFWTAEQLFAISIDNFLKVLQLYFAFLLVCILLENIL